MAGRVAVVDDEAAARKRLGEAFSRDGYQVETFGDAEAFLARQGQAPFDAVLLDLRLPGMDGLAALKRVKAMGGDTEVVLVTGFGGLEPAIEAIKLGAYHFVAKPVRLAEIRNLIKAACDKVALGRANRQLRQALREETGLESMIGASAAMRGVFELVRKIAPVNCNVLIQGASGTGKALVAKAIHKLSPRRDETFVSFNCGGFTEELIASELFGYEKGAFTGASATRAGLLESAGGGTVFLDEIGEMPPSMQVKLLHVIQERRILRVGGVKPIDLDIRVIAATNRDLKSDVAEGLFREDLFYRLNVVNIHLPSLSERREDIPLLARHFIDKYSLLFHKSVRELSPQALQMLSAYAFPGNVRELENIVERGVALCDGDIFDTGDLPRELNPADARPAQADEPLVSLEELERRHIARVLESTGRNKSLAAQILDVPRTTLWRKLKQFHLE
ncbi:MAG: Fis family transcriptional regulator [Desulfovibrionaceae bacterium CG1_02_65_16]|nr:MAG: Fis family transcriptional regulator [Desulfovibrionaceae bacterium CG1_02_65_16]